MAEKRRLFFALWPEAPLREAITRSALAVARERALGGREIPAERVHMTLLFLGDVAPRAEAQLIAGAGELGARAFELRLDRAGCFYRSRVFWLGASQMPRALTGLWQDLQTLAGRAGLQADPRPLAAHVTCLRDIEHRIRPVSVKQIAWPVRQFALVHSALGPAPAYHVVSQWPLRMPS